MTTTRPPTTAVAARAVHATKVYGQGDTEVRALDAVNVEFERARYTAIMGASGSGKSTLLHCVAGLDRLTTGDVWIGEINLNTLNDKELTRVRRDHIGFIFQSFNLIPTLNAMENITLPMALAGRKPDQAIERGIYSFTSSDEGLTFAPDNGVRITAAAAGTDGVSGPVIVKMATGGWRMYFSDAQKPGDVSPKKIVSAFSTDLLTWTKDAGVRIGAGSSAVTGGAEHPAAIANADGSVTLVYLRVLPPGPHAMFYSTSADGLSFPREARMGLPMQTGFTIEGNDPELLHMPSGDVRIYYGVGDNTRGTIYTASRAPFTVNTP
mgnify:CR=1 FL=1